MASFRSGIAEAVAPALAIAAGVAATCAVLALAGRMAPPLDIFAHFAPIYGLVALASGLIAFVAGPPRRGAIVGLATIGVVASAVLIAPELRPRPAPMAPAGAPNRIKVIQFNADRANADIGRVADWLIAQDADIVTITEARHDLRDLLVARGGWKTAGAHGHLIIFTREPYFRMDRPERPGGWNTTFVNASYANPTGPIEAVTAHLRWPTEGIAAQQVGELRQVVERLPRRRMVVTGDFNATPWSAEVRRLDRSLGLIRRDRALATWPAQVFGRRWPLPFLPIDHVYAGREWATVKVERGPWLGSDHYPLVVTLAPVAPR